ncbi:MAG TPA: DUF1844 domain-containing protein [Acidobacteriaceae bacterium]
MSEKPPAFVVHDRRKFTAEGEIREGYTPPTAAEVAAAAAPPVQPEAAPKVVTMPSRSTVEADDRGTAEDQRQSRQQLAGYDGDGLSSDEEAVAALGPDLADELGDGLEMGPPPTAAETAAQRSAYQRSARDMDTLLAQANPGMQIPAVVGFEHIVQSFYLSAIMAMGAGTEPGQKPRIDILAARQSIDMLNVLAEKTRGNLEEKEQRLLDGVAFELRMMFLELTNAIAAQAQAPPPGRK